MTRESGFDVTAFKTNLDDMYRDRLTNSEPAGVDLFSQAYPRDVAKPAAHASADPLTAAVDSMRGEVIVDAVERVKAAQAQAAKDNKDQLALAQNPAEMRKLFPQLLKDLHHRDPDHIALDEIESGLKDQQLSQLEKNFLTVLKRGYDKFQYTPTADAFVGEAYPTDELGVSAGSLAMIDKALHRDTWENPWLSYQCLHHGLKSAVASGLFFGGLSAAFDHNPKQALGTAVGVGAMFGLFGAAMPLLSRVVGDEKNMYDKIEINYNSFLTDLKR